MSDYFSLSTVLVSAFVSVATGYVGSLLSTGRLRQQERRVYGLALLAEVKTIHRSLWRYQARMASIGSADADVQYKDVKAVVGLWRQDRCRRELCWKSVTQSGRMTISCQAASATG